MNEKKLLEKLDLLLKNIYCDDCKFHIDRDKPEVKDWIERYGDPCEDCHRKNMEWEPSERLLKKIIKTVKEELKNE